MDIYHSLKNNALELPCPDCGTILRFGLDDLRQNRVLTCTCGSEVALEEQAKSSRKLAKAADDLEKALKKLGLE